MTRASAERPAKESVEPAASASVAIPGVGRLLEGRLGRGVFSLLLFAFGLTGLLVAFATGVIEKRPSLVRADPVIVDPDAVIGFGSHPGYLPESDSGGLDLTVEVGPEKTSVELLSPIFTREACLPDSRLPVDLAVSFGSILLSLLFGWGGRRPGVAVGGEERP